MSTKTERARPINIAAERAVLAGICQFGGKVYTEISDILNKNCFSSTDNQILFHCVSNILSTSDVVDISSILSEGTSLGYADLLTKKDMADYIKSIFLFSVNHENVRKNSVILRKLQFARDGQDTAKNIWLDLGSVTGTEPIGELMSRIEGPILSMDFGADSGEDSTKKLSDYGDEIFSQLEKMDGKPVGIPSPWIRYNQAIGGGRRPGYIYLTCARSKQGKSQLGIADALFVAEQCNINVLILDSEMSSIDFTTRIWANLANVPTNSIEDGSFALNSFTRAKVLDAKERVSKMPLHYRKIAGKPFDEILSIIRKWVIQDVGLVNGVAKPCLLIYDYFKLMDSGDLENMQEYQALGFQINSLSIFLSKYKIACSAFIQANRQGVDNDTSAIISQSDRLLWLCASFAILKKKTQDEIAVDGAENGSAKLIVTSEQRFGPGLEDGNYINLKAQFDRCIITEGVTRRELKSKPQNTGFETIDDSSDNFEDKDFDVPAYRDKEYRTVYQN